VSNHDRMGGLFSRNPSFLSPGQCTAVRQVVGNCDSGSEHQPAAGTPQVNLSFTGCPRFCLQPRLAFRRLCRKFLAERQEPVNPFASPEEKCPLGQPICSVTGLQQRFDHVPAICTPIQTKKDYDKCVIIVIPVAPRIRANQ